MGLWIVVLGWTLGWAHAAAPVPKELLETVLRPLPRLVLTSTRPGALLGERAFGEKLSSDVDLYALLRRMGDDAPELARRVAAAESEMRALLTSGAGVEEALTRLEGIAARWLALKSTAGEAGASLRFVAAPAAERLSPARARFLADATGPGPAALLSGQDLSSAALAGRDLRFADLRGARLGDLRGADLRGADLRNAVVTDATRLDDAAYDQYTRFTLSRAEAYRLGMRYRLSTPPEGFLYQNVEAAVRSAVAAGAPPPPLEDAAAVAAAALKRLPELSKEMARGVRLLARPEHVVPRGQEWIRFEAGAVEKGSFGPEMDALIDELTQAGGEVRRLVAVRPSGEVLNHGMAYFRTENGRPFISVSPNAHLPTLHHERQHFRDFRDLVAGIQAERGVDRETAILLSNKVRSKPAWKQYTERKAIIAEFQAQARIDAEAGLPIAARKYRFESREFAARVTYPEREAIGQLYQGRTFAEIQANPKLKAESDRYLRKILRVALNARRSWFEHLGLESAAAFTRDELFNEVIAGNRHRYAASGTLEDIQRAFQELLPWEAARLPKGKFKRAVLLAL